MKTKWAVILVVNEGACGIEILSEHMCVGAMKCFKIFGYESINPALRVYIDPDAWLMACEELQRDSVGCFVESDLR